MIDLLLEQSQIIPSHTLSGEFTWQPDNPDKEPKSAQVAIAWFTEGRGTRDYKTVASQSIEPERLLKFRQRPFEFQLAVPYDAPLTYNGHMFRLIWEVEVRIVFPGIFRPKEKVTQVIQVIPH